jgi:hypothetical protein
MIKTELTTEAYKATLQFYKEIVINEDDYQTQSFDEEAFTLTVYTTQDKVTGLHTLQPFMEVDGKPTLIEADDMQEFDLATPNLWDALLGNLSEYLALADGLPEWSHSYSPE